MEISEGEDQFFMCLIYFAVLVLNGQQQFLSDDQQLKTWGK